MKRHDTFEIILTVFFVLLLLAVLIAVDTRIANRPTLAACQQIAADHGLRVYPVRLEGGECQIQIRDLDGENPIWLPLQARLLVLLAR